MLIPAEGSPTSYIAVVGEAPGRREAEQGQAFVGPSGKLLWISLGRHGIYREDCYITNVIKDGIIRDPLLTLTPPQLHHYVDAIRAELSATSCNVYAALGKTALYALTGETAIDSWRGSLMQTTWGAKCIPTYHPAYLLRQPEKLKYFKSDIEFIAEECSTEQLVLPQRTLYTNPIVEEVEVFINYIIGNHELVSYDIETEMRTGVLLCVSLCVDPNYSISIPLHGQRYWEPQDYMRVVAALKRLFSDPHLIKIGHNETYDITGLRAMGIEVVPPYEDTMYMSHCLDPIAPDGHSLATVVSTTTRQPFYKEWDQVPLGLSEGQTKPELLREYNAMDSAITLEAHSVMKSQLTERGQWPLFKNHYARLQPYLNQMYEDGLCIDASASAKLASELRSEAQQLEAALTDSIGTRVTVNSHAKIKHILYNILQFPEQYKKDPRTRKKMLTVDDDALLALYIATQSPFVLKIRKARKNYKLVSFLEPKGKDAQRKRKTWDGRIRTEYKPMTKTRRLSSSFSSASRLGINLQNIPPRVREVFVPAPGCIFLEVDYSQAEARVLAWDACDYDLMHKFDLAVKDPTSYDTHWHVAEMIMGKPRAELHKDDRQTCKHINFGTWYDMYPKKIQETILKHSVDAEGYPLFLPLGECDSRQRRFKSAMPRMLAWQDEITNTVLQTGQLYNAFGWCVAYHEVVTDPELKYCFGRRDLKDERREWLSMRPQSTVALMCCRSLMDLDDELRRWKIGRVAAQVHDSLLLEVLDGWDHVANAFHFAKEIMEAPIRVKGAQMVIPIDAKLGYSWLGEVKDIRSEEDLWQAYQQIRRTP